MNKNIIIIIVVVLMALLFGFFYLKGSSDSVDNSSLVQTSVNSMPIRNDFIQAQKMLSSVSFEKRIFENPVFLSLQGDNKLPNGGVLGKTNLFSW